MPTRLALLLTPVRALSSSEIAKSFFEREPAISLMVKVLPHVCSSWRTDIRRPCM
jgi:hypothetical protein